VLFFIAILIGGRGSILGPMLGTIILTILPEIAAPLAAWSTFLYAVLLLVIVLVMPGGIAALLDFRNRRPLASNRAIVPRPAALADIVRKRTGGSMLTLRGIALSFGNVRAIDGLDLDVAPGQIHGLIGPNGSGKTTLLKLLLGELQPQAGEVRIGTQLQVAYFDQYRATLREDWNALENVAEGLEFVEIGGKRKHVIGYLQDFLFTPERARAPITRLSGGERNRLLLAKLFAQPSNLLVMDEPTNDLDVETLELLEELLGEYPGTLLLVSHDRDFLDNVVTSTLVMQDGNGPGEEGRIGDYVGGYSDWLRQRSAAAMPATSVANPAAKTAVNAPTAAVVARRKLSYQDARDLEQLPARIEVLENRVAALTAAMHAPAFYQREIAAINADNATLAQAQSELDTAYARWEALEAEI
jgi:ATP-binding cassette subfamily F protein uup